MSETDGALLILGAAAYFIVMNVALSKAEGDHETAMTVWLPLALIKIALISLYRVLFIGWRDT